MNDAPAAPMTLPRTSIGDLRLENGEVLADMSVAALTRGRLAPDRRNAVLVTHGDSSGPRMIEPPGPLGSHAGEGSWSGLVGPGAAIDTDRFFVIRPNMIGSSYGSTGPASVNPATGRPYGPTFPDISVGDIVAAERALLGHLASGMDWGKWAPRLAEFLGRVAPAGGEKST